MICSRCGIDAEVSSGPDGAFYCSSCLIRVSSERCADCFSRSKSGIVACPFCPSGTEADTRTFENQVKRGTPIAVEENCERCGGSIHGNAYILNRKVLCRSCLIYEQKRWEIVPGKPGSSGSRVRIVIEKPKPTDANLPDPGQVRISPKRNERLLGIIGIDPDDPPTDPFGEIHVISEMKMPDESCRSCEAYRLGRIRKSSYMKDDIGAKRK